MKAGVCRTGEEEQRVTETWRVCESLKSFCLAPDATWQVLVIR